MNNPIIDWPLSIQLAGNNMDHAKEFLELLTKDLSTQLEIIRAFVKHDKRDQLKKELHKLLGGLSYSGAIRLKSATSDFYHAAKNNENILLCFLQFETEALLFLKHAEKYAS
jgi:HPt (histidine-containing phosphotransfer) domain-containing protein